MFAAPGICAISTRIINGYYVFPSSSFRDSDTSNKSEATYIHLTGGRRQNEICGKLKITQQIGDKLCKTVSNQWPHYALVVELQGQLTTTNSLGARCQIPLPQLVPEENSELICNSKIFTLVSGEENGLKKQLDLKECPRSCLVRNPATFPFKLQLPENHDQLPSTIQCPNIFIEYFLVAYLRTEHGYEEVDKRALQRFRGHNLVPKFPSISESVSWTTSTKAVTIVGTSPQKFYRLWIKQPFLFNVTLTFGQIFEGSISVKCIVSIIQRISLGGAKLRETVIAAKSESKQIKRLSLTFCGKLHEASYSIGDDDKMLLASFNQNEEGLKIQHYLKCLLTMTTY
ncbi:uncharacterized protein LOC118432872 isoform X2 [Folsomia candida]|uniref:uncharacterized protein LOC118432872 isoform X2 n=1 Tax=Folsomia candida TaxID=158441 RepID=UPI001604D0DB|nr:uncharacterized protein LOC118432872 isoform X2 [Folsomia candida]